MSLITQSKWHILTLQRLRALAIKRARLFASDVPFDRSNMTSTSYSSLETQRSVLVANIKEIRHIITVLTTDFFCLGRFQMSSHSTERSDSPEEVYADGEEKEEDPCR